jgi:predicted CXXCH cytochrome family protein
MHGPVAEAECLLCHSPHESSVPHLLRMRSPRLCVQCHVVGTTLGTRPEHQDAKADCLECHVGHGSTKHGLLKPAPPATQPAAALTNSPSGIEVRGAGL